MPAVLELSRQAAAVFAERGFEQPRLEAELLLAGILCMKRLDLYLQHDRPVSEAELARYRAAVRRRLKREPLQYVLGSASFRHLELRVDARVLIPRPETEQVVGAVLAWARAADRSGAALDIGTGSGAIALSLAREGAFERVVATDASSAALEVARLNRAAAGLEDRVELRHGSLFEPLRASERFDVIVSNPPYVAEPDAPSLAVEVRDHEPREALFAGATGLEVIERLVAGAADWLAPGALLALEFGAGQGSAVVELLRGRGAYEKIEIRPDLTGRDRIAIAERA